MRFGWGARVNRRDLLGLMSAALLASALPAHAKDFADQIVRQLRRQGYGSITQNRTWLGRIQIVASKPDEYREIIIDPRTGEILRDYWRILSGTADTTTPLLNDNSGDGGGGNSGSGDDDDDKDDDSKDDNSGQGS